MGGENMDEGCTGVGGVVRLGCIEGLWGPWEGAGGCSGVCMGGQGAYGCWGDTWCLVGVQGGCKGSESACGGCVQGFGAVLPGLVSHSLPWLLAHCPRPQLAVPQNTRRAAEHSLCHRVLTMPRHAAEHSPCHRALAMPWSTRHAMEHSPCHGTLDMPWCAPRATHRYLGALNITESLRADIAAGLPRASPVCLPGHHRQHRQAPHCPWGQSHTAAPSGTPSPGGFRCPSPAFSTQRCWQPSDRSTAVVLYRVPVGTALAWFAQKPITVPCNLEQGHVPGLPHGGKAPRVSEPPPHRLHQAENAPGQG